MIDDNINYEYIIRYLRDLLPERKGLSKELEQYAKEHSVPISQPETMKLLEVLIRCGSVERVLEIGCAIGYSAICMAQAGCTHIDTIEISPEAAEIARSNFKKAGLSEVITLHLGDAKEVLPQMEGTYDMIFMDLNMPIMDGYEAAKSIRGSKKPDASDIPILAVTANAMAKDIVKVHEAGMNERITKPVQRELLYQTMEKYIL